MNDEAGNNNHGAAAEQYAVVAIASLAGGLQSLIKVIG